MRPLAVSFDEFRTHLGGIGKTKGHSIIKAGEVDCVKIGRRTAVTLESIERFIARSTIRRGEKLPEPHRRDSPDLAHACTKSGEVLNITPDARAEDQNRAGSRRRVYKIDARGEGQKTSDANKLGKVSRRRGAAS